MAEAQSTNGNVRWYNTHLWMYDFLVIKFNLRFACGCFLQTCSKPRRVSGQWNIHQRSHHSRPIALSSHFLPESSELEIHPALLPPSRIAGCQAVANFFVVGRCPETILLPHFRKHFSENHLDVGVATGYFPSKTIGLNRSSSLRSEVTQRQHITLVDIEPATLRTAQARILKSDPHSQVQCIQADATAPLPSALRGKEYDSISLFNLLHCIQGPERKLDVLRIYSEILAEGGVLYGNTLLGHEYAPNWFSKWWASRFESDGAFHCWNDTKEMFDEALQKVFEESETWVVGYMLLFKASTPRQVQQAVLL